MLSYAIFTIGNFSAEIPSSEVKIDFRMCHLRKIMENFHINDYIMTS